MGSRYSSGIEPRPPRPADPLALAETGAQSPEQFGPFLLIRTIGSGGMGNVYLVRTPWEDRPVAALKRMRLSDKLLEERFRHEAALTVRLDHHNLIATYDVGAIKDQLYVCSELILGKDLGAIGQALVQGGRGCTVTMAYGVFIDVLSALRYIHNARDIDETPLNLVHRDIKPANIIVGYDGISRVADFGAAKSLLTADLELTAPGTLVATPTSIAPELLRGEVATPASDIYSLGSSMYRLLTGMPPHPGKSVKQVLMSVLLETPRPISALRPDLPPWFAEIIHRMLEKDQNHRPHDAGQILAWVSERAKTSGLAASQQATGRWLMTVFAAEHARELAEKDSIARMRRTGLGELDDETRVFAHAQDGMKIKTDVFDLRTEVGMPRLDGPVGLSDDSGEFEVATSVDSLPREPSLTPVSKTPMPIATSLTPVPKVAAKPAPKPAPAPAPAAKRLSAAALAAVDLIPIDDEGDSFDDRTVQDDGLASPLDAINILPPDVGLPDPVVKPIEERKDRRTRELPIRPISAPHLPLDVGPITDRSPVADFSPPPDFQFGVMRAQPAPTLDLLPPRERLDSSEPTFAPSRAPKTTELPAVRASVGTRSREDSLESTDDQSVVNALASLLSEDLPAPPPPPMRDGRDTAPPAGSLREPPPSLREPPPSLREPPPSVREPPPSLREPAPSSNQLVREPPTPMPSVVDSSLPSPLPDLADLIPPDPAATPIAPLPIATLTPDTSMPVSRGVMPVMPVDEPRGLRRWLPAIAAAVVALIIGVALGTFVLRSPSSAPDRRVLGELSRARDSLRARAAKGETVPQNAWLLLDATWAALNEGDVRTAEHKLDELEALMREEPPAPIEVP